MGVEGEEKKWNEEWEKKLFEGMVIGEGWWIERRLEKESGKSEYEIVIKGEMGLGRGDDERRRCIMREVLEGELKGK